ncbi:MAG: hypothetical protein ACYDD4_09415 [Acidimicrobiales bacterium]
MTPTDSPQNGGWGAGPSAPAAPGTMPGVRSGTAPGAATTRPGGPGGQGVLFGKGLRSTAPRGGGRSRPPRRRNNGGASGGIDLRNTWQILAGSILIPLGVVFILKAWYGAAHTAYVQQQIPYLVSGSFVGLGCLVLGGLLYWAHWLYRLYDQADLHHDEQLKMMEQLIRAVGEHGAGGAAGLLPAPPSASQMVDTGETPSTPQYVVTPTGSVYHLPTCAVVSHHSEGLRVLGSGGVVDMEPCRICMPQG